MGEITNHITEENQHSLALAYTFPRCTNTIKYIYIYMKKFRRCDQCDQCIYIIVLTSIFINKIVLNHRVNIHLEKNMSNIWPREAICERFWVVNDLTCWQFNTKSVWTTPRNDKLCTQSRTQDYYLIQNFWSGGRGVSCSNCRTYLLYIIGQSGLNKQLRPRSDAAERGVWSGSTLFATATSTRSQIVKLKKNVKGKVSKCVLG